MKFFLSITLFIFPILLFSQEYSEVVQAEGKTAEQLYLSAKEWFALSFNSATDVIQLEDEKNRKLIGKGIKSYQYITNSIPSIVSVYFTMVVETKDNRFKQTISNISYSGAFGQELDFSELEKIGTEDGLKELYEKMGIKPWIIGKKQFMQNLDLNKKLLVDIDRGTKDILTSLREFILTEKKSAEDW